MSMGYRQFLIVAQAQAEVIIHVERSGVGPR